MSASFYPSFIGGGGGGGNIDYDKIQNKPIIDLNGSETVPDIISALAYGNYLVKGYYKLDDNAEEQYADVSFNLIVSKDKESGAKVFSYTIIKDGKPYMVIGTYGNDGSIESLEEIPLGQMIWGNF